jgi:hypothetical protein
VDLINTDHSDLSAELREVLDKESLWGDEKNFDLLLGDGLEDGFFGVVGLLRVDSCTRDEGGKLVELVSHQGDKGGDH